MVIWSNHWEDASYFIMRGCWLFIRWTVPEPCPNLPIEYFLDFYLLKVVYRLKVDLPVEYLEFQLVRLLVLDLDFPFLKFHEFLCPGIFSVNRYLLGWVSSSWFSTPRSLVSNWLIMSERFFRKNGKREKIFYLLSNLRLLIVFFVVHQESLDLTFFATVWCHLYFRFIFRDY